MEYVIYTLLAAGIVGLGGRSYFEKQQAVKAKAKRDVAASTKRRNMLALAGPDPTDGKRRRRAQFGKR